MKNLLAILALAYLTGCAGVDWLWRGDEITETKTKGTTQ